MPRKNQVARHRNVRGRLDRRQKGESRRLEVDTLPPRVPVEELVIPDGKCRRNPRHPKDIFMTEESAQRALEQAQIARRRMGSGHVEKRYYPCPAKQGGCGGFHLTSRETYEERGPR